MSEVVGSIFLGASRMAVLSTYERYEKRIEVNYRPAIDIIRYFRATIQVLNSNYEYLFEQNKDFLFDDIRGEGQFYGRIDEIKKSAASPMVWEITGHIIAYPC